ncbi:MAG: hypothetical protein RDV48_06620 [Candidatus Eremiobacteraeota bacterium]|nr:hypothetical protein [Candidatus Eremiobacteraeota bacterium]
MDNTIRPLQFNAVQKQGDLSMKPESHEKEGPSEGSRDDSVSISRPDATQEPPRKIKVNILPQSPAVTTAKTVDFPQDQIGSTVSNNRMQMVDKSNPKAIPDLEGNYLYEVGTPQFDQVNAFATAARGMEMAEKFRGSSINWAFSSKLSILPHKQEGKNAYYSRQDRSANFFFFKSPPLDKVVQTSEDPDIVIHEIVGHGALDGIRPQYLGWDSETMGTHEAYSDIAAMNYALHDEGNIKLLLEQNGGNFRNESLVSRLGEEFGKAIHLEDQKPENDNQLYLRSMLNKFTYADPDSLPDTHDPDQLSGESHSFSRVLSGACYDLIDGLYQKNLPGSKDQTEAVVKARDTFGDLFYKAIDLAPQTKCKYKDVALGMIKADRLKNGGSNEQEIRKAFLDRKIITESDISKLDAHMEALPSVRLKKSPSTAQDVQKFLEAHGGSLGVPDGLTLKLTEIARGKNGDTTVSLQFTEEMPLSGKEFGKYEGYVVDVNGGLTIAFDKSGNLVDATFDSIDEEKKQDVRNGVLNCIKKDLVTEQSKSDSIFKTDTEIYQGLATSTPDGKKKIMRIPVVS